MSPTEAKEAILVHAGFAIMETKPGLLGRIRPYQGLDEADFAEIVQSILTLYPLVTAAQDVDKSLVAALWWLCDRSRVLMLNPTSSVRHNRLASDAELVRLSSWIDVIESMANRMLQSIDLPIGMYRLLEYISGRKSVDPSRFSNIVPYIEQCVSFDDSDVVDAANRALSVIRNGTCPAN